MCGINKQRKRRRQRKQYGSMASNHGMAAASTWRRSGVSWLAWHH